MPNDAFDIRDIKPLQEVPLGTSPWFIVAIIVLLLILMGVVMFWAMRRQRRTLPPSPVRLDPPDVIALRELDLLMNVPRNTLLERQQFFFSLSLVLRQYVEAQLSLNCTDLTTWEIHQLLKDKPLPHLQAQKQFLTLLEEADTIKFAKQDRDEQGCLKALNLARDFVVVTQEEMIKRANVPSPLQEPV